MFRSWAPATTVATTQLCLGQQFYACNLVTRAEDLHSFFIEPDPEVFLNANPDPAA